MLVALVRLVSMVASSLIAAINPVAAVSATVVPLCIAPPVKAPMVRGYEEPACTYCAGHRTLDFAGAGDIAGDIAGVDAETATLEVVAPVDGRVRFVGFVARIRYVSIAPVADPEHTVTVGWTPVSFPVDEIPVDGIPVDEIPVDEIPVDEIPVDGGASASESVRVGAPVRVGSRLGSTSMGAVVTLSLRNEIGGYEDPAPHLGDLRVRARLVPLDGSGRRPPRSAVCRPVR